jgi:UDP-2-acetamido-2-deoxy-ribo-hexuluronate aminotransferase
MKQKRDKKIPIVDLTGQYKTIHREIDNAIKEVLQSSYFIMGHSVRIFEEEIASYCGVKYGIGCASGTDALQLALMVIGVKPGDEVITTPFTFVATAEVISILGAKPVFVDIDSDTYLIDPDNIKKVVTKKNKSNYSGTYIWSI